jgi:hypothetical protein
MRKAEPIVILPGLIDRFDGDGGGGGQFGFPRGTYVSFLAHPQHANTRAININK